MTGMKTMTATEFKAKCLQILDHVPPEGLAITKRGQTVAEIYPKHLGIERLFGSIPDLVNDNEDDFFSTGLRWDAES